MVSLVNMSAQVLFNPGFCPAGGGRGANHMTIGMIFEVRNVIIVGCRGHGNQCKILLGPGSFRVGLRRGDNLFWVIRCPNSMVLSIL
jgi:hypothetical protein